MLTLFVITIIIISSGTISEHREGYLMDYISVKEAEKLADARIKSGKYIKERNEE